MKNLLILHSLILFSISSFAQDTNNTNKASNLNTYFENVKFRNIGPFRGGRSVTTSGVKGDPLTYYMGTTGGGLWKTDDAGQHWKNISDGYFKTGSVGAVAVSESDPNVVYCGMGEHAPRGVMTSYGDGVYKSTDAGKTWSKIGLEKTQHISRIIIHPKNPDIVYVAAQGALYGRNAERGIFKSTDGGANWEKVLYINERTGCSELSIDKSNPQVLYAAMWEHQRLPWKVISGGPGSGLYKSTDGGMTWNKIHNGLPQEKGKMAVSVSQSNPEKVYALIESDSQQDKSGLFISNNAGKSWSKISGDNRLTQRAWYYTEVFADPQDENTVYVLSAPCLRSIDGGKTWSRITGTHGDYHDLWINPDNPRNLSIANDGGAAISFNYGESWSTQANMPTAQFYRVTTDNLFPYNIYGGQQDNTSVKIAHRALERRSIDQRDWTYSAGGESAFLAFDPDNPRYVLGGSYQGTIEVLDTQSNAGTGIMAAPHQYLGEDAKDIKYRFNWNAPIIRSQHEPDTYYHAAQVLLRTKDLGKTWEEVSPDLTKNEKEKQGKGGGPYTNEAVGAENYGTIAYVAESPHEAGVIWVGTDDGLVQLTKDNGESWTNVTPKGLQECLVNAIDISPHDPATAYIATTRYKFNDHTPGLYKTTNYGKTWSNINKGIPNGAYTRVVREDEKRKGLLFAGTETGLYISWNDGKDWKPFNLNLPVTPINDLIVKHNDLIIATSGRSFWVLDDLALLQTYQPGGNAVKIHQPEDVILTSGGSALNSNSPKVKGTHPFYGVNPASGAVLYYHLPEVDKDNDITLEIKNSDGNLIRTFSSKKDPESKRWAGGPPPASNIPNDPGLNRFVWDLRHETMSGVPGVYIEGSYRGHKAIPGSYTATIKYANQSSSTTFEIKSNPLYPTTQTEYKTYHNFMTGMEKELSAMHNMVNDLNHVSGQLEILLENMPEDSKHNPLIEEGHTILGKIKAWDEKMVQRKSKAYDDVENFRNKFTANYIFLINQTESAIPRVNQSSIERREELEVIWSELKNEGRSLLKNEIPAYTKTLWQAGIGALWLAEE